MNKLLLIVNGVASNSIMSLYDVDERDKRPLPEVAFGIAAQLYGMDAGTEAFAAKLTIENGQIVLSDYTDVHRD